VASRHGRRSAGSIPAPAQEKKRPSLKTTGISKNHFRSLTMKNYQFTHWRRKIQHQLGHYTIEQEQLLWLEYYAAMFTALEAEVQHG
jgi:hypothetical protein